MKPSISRRNLCQFALAATAWRWAEPARACEYFAATLRISHPWTRSTGPGQDSAMVGMTFDEVREDDRLIGVDTPVAQSAELASAGAAGVLDLPIPAGQVTVLHAEGSFVRLTGLKAALEIGRMYPLRLHFAKGGVVLANLNVDYTRFT